MELTEHGAVTRTGEMEMRATDQLKILLWQPLWRYKSRQHSESCCGNHFGDTSPGSTAINEMDLLQTGCTIFGRMK